MESHSFPGCDSLPKNKVTISVGVSGFPEDGANGDTLIQRADQALIPSKRNRRNAVCIAPEGVANQQLMNS